MPKGTPDESVVEPRVEALDLPRRITPREEGISTGPALGEIGDALEAKFQRDTATAAGNQLTDFHLSMLQASEDAKAHAAPGAQGYTQSVLNAFDQQAKGLLASSPDGVQKAMQPGLKTLRTTFGEQAVQYEAQQGVMYRQQSVKDNTDKLATIVQAQPGQFESTMGNVLTQINSVGLPADKRLESARYAQSVLARASIDSRIQTDPYGTLTALLKPDAEDKVVNALTPEERQVATTRADAMLHQRVADATRLDEMKDRAERRQASAGLTNLIEKSKSPEGVTTDDVLKMAPLFRHEPAALEGALSLVNGKNVTSDPAVYAPLLHRAVQGEDVYNDAVIHLGRDLDAADFTRLVDMGEKGLGTVHQQAERYINDALKPGQFNFDPLLSQTHAEAEAAYHAWAIANPNATLSETMGQARMLTGAMSTVEGQARTAKLDVPTFVVGEPKTGLDVDATEVATVRAEQAGAITHADAVKQAALLMKWRDVQTRLKAAGGAPVTH